MKRPLLTLLFGVAFASRLYAADPIPTRPEAGLTVTAPVVTASFNAPANAYVPLDATANTVNAVLPANPPDRTRVGAKLIALSYGNAAILSVPSGAFFNRVNGGSSIVLSLLNQGVVCQYNAATAVWIVTEDDLPLSQLDLRYANQAALNAETNRAQSAEGTLTGTSLQSAATGLDPFAAFSQVTTTTLLRDSFAGLSPAWTATSVRGTWSTAADPAYVCAPRTPVPALAPNVGTPYAGGVRESNTLVDVDGTWYRYVGAGDGSGNAATGPWRPQTFRSTDNGATWQYVGQTLTDPPALAGDMLSVARNGSLYVLYAMHAASFTNNAIPSTPYYDATYTASSPLGPWTATSASLGVGAIGSYDQDTATTGSVVFSGATFYDYYSARTPVLPAGAQAAQWNLALATSQAAAGAWSKQGTILPDYLDPRAENPKVWASTALGRWVMVANYIDLSAAATTGNVLWVSATPSTSPPPTSWAGATRVQLQRLCPADGQLAVGLLSPVALGNGTVAQPGGNVPATFDADPTDSTLHQGRKVYQTVLEPSPASLTFTPSTADAFFEPFAYPNGSVAQAGWTGDTSYWNVFNGYLTATNADGHIVLAPSADVFADGCIDLDALRLADPNADLGIYYRAQANGDGYLARFAGSNEVELYTRINGTYTAVATATTTSPQVTWMHLQVRVVGSIHQLYMNGTLVLSHIDATFASGGFGMRGNNTGTIYAKNYRVSAVPPTPDTLLQPLSSPDFVARFAWQPQRLNGSGSFACNFRQQANGDHYFLTMGSGGSLTVRKSVGGVVTILANTAAPTLLVQAGMMHRVQLQVGGSSIQAWLDGELQCSATDTAITGAGAFGFANGGVRGNVRNLVLTSVPVNSTNVPNVATLQSSLAPVLSVTGSTALTSAALGQEILCTGTSADYSVTLPTAASCALQKLTLAMDSGLTVRVGLNAAGSDLIDGQSSRIMWAGESATLYSDGTAWRKVGGKSIPMTVKLQAQGSNQTVPVNNYAAATMTTLVSGFAEMFDSANGRVLIQRPGTYTATGFAYLASGGTLAVGVAVNAAANQSTANNGYAVASPNGGASFTNSLACVGGAYVDLFFYAFGSGATILGTSVGNYPQLYVKEESPW